MINQDQLNSVKLHIKDIYSNDFPYQRTLIPYFENVKKHNSLGYILEAGGTNWRITERKIIDNQVSWNVVADGKESLINYDSENSLITYFEFLLNKIKSYTTNNSFDFFAIIWSNSSIAEEINYQGIKGISLITDFSRGYNKKEGFIRDLKDQTNLGKLFIDLANDFKFKFLLMANDSAILPCLGNYQAGAVISTGANSTTLMNFNNKLEHVNLESGNYIKIPKNYLYNNEIEFFAGQDISIEYLCAGKYYPRFLELSLERELNLKIKLEARNIQDFISGDFTNFNELTNKEAITKVANQVCLRAASYGALLLYSSLVALENIYPGSTHKIALDSTIARKSPSYYSNLINVLENLSDYKFKIDLIELKEVNQTSLAAPSQAVGGLIDYYVSIFA